MRSQSGKCIRKQGALTEARAARRSRAVAGSADDTASAIPVDDLVGVLIVVQQELLRNISERIVSGGLAADSWKGSVRLLAQRFAGCPSVHSRRYDVSRIVKCMQHR